MRPAAGTILVVDDLAPNRDMLAKWLEKRGHRALTAEGADAALARIEDASPDLVLLDIMMPGVDGFEVLTRIRARRSLMELPVVMVTAKDQSEDVVRALELGANDYITKPLDFAVVLARVQTQLALKQLADTRAEFIRVASHDLKNPLTAILAAARTIPMIAPSGAPVTPDLADLMERVGRRAREMQRIIEDFLDFHALEDGRLQAAVAAVALHPLLIEVVDGMRDYADSKRITLSLKDVTAAPVALADPVRVTQIAQNIVGNALKFSPPGRSVLVRLAREDGHAIVEVSDEGPGLTDDDLRKVFGKYARLSNKPTGGEKSSGLGLAICRQLVELQGGRIGVRRNEPCGATFWFSLPLASAD